jgi:leucyl-tRNA synthetase
LAVKGKVLATAFTEQADWLYLYSIKLAEVEKLLNYSDSRVQAIRGKLFKTYSEKYSRELSDRQKDKYIDNEDQYLQIYQIYLEIKEVRDKYKAAVDAFIARGYALKNLLDARINSLELLSI